MSLHVELCPPGINQKEVKLLSGESECLNSARGVGKVGYCARGSMASGALTVVGCCNLKNSMEIIVMDLVLSFETWCGA
jgi:hypothetical protein